MPFRCRGTGLPQGPAQRFCIYLDTEARGMSLNQRDETILSELRKAQAIHPDIKELLNFYENLFRTQFAFKSQLEISSEVSNFEKKEVNLTGVAKGLPQITFDDLNMQATPFLDLYRSIVRLLIPYVGDRSGLETEPTSEKIIERAREIFDSRGPLVVSGATQNLARIASGFVLAPYLQLACDLMLPRIPLNLWFREYCPICGGIPSFAALTSGSGQRTLLCPRCYGEWSYDRVGCPFCKSTDPQTYYPSDEGRYRLYVCEACNRYIKTVDVREQNIDLCLPVECLVTASMDISAQERGFIS